MFDSILRTALAEFQAIKEVLQDIRDTTNDIYFLFEQVSDIEVIKVPGNRDLNFMPEPGEVAKALDEVKEKLPTSEQLRKESDNYASGEQREDKLDGIEKEN
jgi:hypothetical protein